MYLQISGVVSSGSTWLATHEARLIWAALAATLGAGGCWWGARRWAARARWYAETPDWAHRINEAPTVRLFPALEEWFNAQTRTWGGTIRILAIPFVVMLSVLIFRMTQGW